MADTHQHPVHTHEAHEQVGGSEPATLVIVGVMLGVIAMIIFVWLWLG